MGHAGTHAPGWVDRAIASVYAVLFLTLSFATEVAQAQAVGKAAAVFDDEEKEKKKDDKKPGDAVKAADVTDRDSIRFTQENVSAQMTELEERMFRLSEALRGLEPENASRLGLALKFSREELILQQMKESQKLLQEAQLNKAETEVRELLAKLEHLRALLLAEDLDFQMKLARLRQMRETLGQLERIIKEERRELAWSRTADEKQAELARQKAARTDLGTLVRKQQEVVRDTRELAKKEPEAERAKAREETRGREEEVKTGAANLAKDPMFASQSPSYLKQADGHLTDAVSQLGTPKADPVAAEEQALDLLQKELDRLADRTGGTEQALAVAEFQKFERDQARNRTAADSLAEVSVRLGGSGVSLQKDLIRAGTAMKQAEVELDKTAARPAAADQLEALKHLDKSKNDLARAIDSLLTELRTELSHRIVAELTEMHEIQAAIRETTQAQAPRVAQRSRSALVTVVGLAAKEAELAERTEQLVALTEETEFGIALPTSLRVLAHQMKKAGSWLKEGDASPRTIALEKRIEEDLLGLLEAMKRLPSSTPPPPGSPPPRDTKSLERELNRLIAELKMIRLIQTRLNDDTTDVDKARPKEPALTPELRREIEALRSSQDEIRSSLGRISQRFDPFAPPPASGGLKDLVP
jgi:hypothetical protein